KRKFVATEVVGPDVDGMLWEGLRHVAVGPVLLFLTGYRAPAHDQELRPEEPDPLGAVCPCSLRLRRQIDVPTQEAGLPVRSDRLKMGEEYELLFPFPDFDVPLPVEGPRLLARLDDDATRAAIEDQLLTRLDDLREI